MSSDDGLTFSQTINPNDHGPYVTVAAALLFTCSLLFYLFRLYTRWPVHRLFESDDVATSIATVFGLLQFIATLYAVHDGIGKHTANLSRSTLEKFYKASFASDILYLACLCFSKTAVSLLVQRLTRVKGHVTATKIISAIILIWGVTSIALAVVPCDSKFSWNSLDNTCTGMYTRWSVVFALGTVLEVCLLVLPVYLVWGVQISPSTKLVVIIAFWCRLPVLIFSILRLLEIKRSVHSSDYTFDLVATAVFTQLEMHFALISATIPSMRPFLKAFDTGYLGTTVAQVDPTATSTKGSKGSVYLMQSSGGRSGRTGRSGFSHEMSVDIAMGRVRPENIEHTAKIEHVDLPVIGGDNGSVATNASDEMIIRKTVDYKVERG